MFHYFVSTPAPHVSYVFAAHHLCVERFLRMTVRDREVFSVYNAIGTSVGSSFLDIPKEVAGKAFRIIIMLNIVDVLSRDVRNILERCVAARPQWANDYSPCE